MIPDQGPGTNLFSGAAIWGGTPVIDPFSDTVYITTGNNYEIPDSAAQRPNELQIGAVPEETPAGEGEGEQRPDGPRYSYAPQPNSIHPTFGCSACGGTELRDAHVIGR